MRNNNKLLEAYKEVFLEIIRDREVSSELYRIFTEQTKPAQEPQRSSFTLISENKERKENYRQLEKQLEDCRNEKKEADIKIQNLNTEKQEAEEKLRNAEQKFAPVSKIAELWEKATQLDESSKSYLKQLCGEFEITALVSLGRDQRKVDQLYNYLKDCAVKPTYNDRIVNFLNIFFEFCVDIMNYSRNEDEKCELFSVDIGSPFDSEKCIRTSSGKQVGVVRRIVTRGVKTQKRILYKSVVEIG